jgi:hypothetical protein
MTQINADQKNYLKLFVFLIRVIRVYLRLIPIETRYGPCLSKIQASRSSTTIVWAPRGVLKETIPRITRARYHKRTGHSKTKFQP